MNNELLSLYKADRQERVNQPKANTPEYKSMRGRDLERRERVVEIAGANGVNTAEDYYHAASIMNHGDTPGDARNAHLFALRSSELGYRPARWLAAAAYDRWQMYQGKPQNMGRIMYMTGGGIGYGMWTRRRRMKKGQPGMCRRSRNNSARLRRQAGIKPRCPRVS